MIRLPQPWTKQPQYPAGIYRANPITSGITFLFNAGAGTTTDYAVSKLSVESGTPVWRTGKYGLGLYSDGTTSRLLYTVNAAPAQPSTLTVFMLCVPEVGGNTGVVAARTMGSGTPSWGMGYHFGSQNGMYGALNGTTADGGSSPITDPGQAETLTYETEAVTFSGGTARFFAKGVQIGSDYTGLGSIDYSRTDQGLQFWSSGAGHSGAKGWLYLVVIFNRVLSDRELVSLSKNPWQLFAPLPRRIFVDAPSGVTNPVGFGTDTLKALTEIATGRTGTRGTASDTLRALTESATGVVTSAQVGFASGTLKTLTDAATGRTGARGTASDTLKTLTEQATGFTSINPVGFATDTLKTLTDVATGRTGVRGTAADTLRAFNEAATGLAGALGNARDTLKALTESATGTITSNAAQGFAAGTLRTLTDAATGRTGAIAGAVDTFKKLTEQAQGRTGMVGFSVDSLKALQAAAGAVSGAQPIAPPGRTGGAPVWWPHKPGGRPWWYRDLKDKTDELERMRQLRIEMGILPKAEAKRIAKVVKEVDAFIEEIPTEDTADEYIARADALTERINALVDKIEEDDDEQTIMEMSRFFFHHRTGASECRIH